ncbi:MAG: hypothetical protein F6J87_18030 [Spirulina sp. SIO3F2]|nr:hypothetical protein [Spirulina sp. SIO3F2]
MKLLAICDPSRYKRKPLDVPHFYLQAARDRQTDFYHIPTPQVFTQPPTSPWIQVAPANTIETYDEFLALEDFANQNLALRDLDLIFCRTLKPFPVGYLAQLQQWEKFAKFVNSPTGIEQQIQSQFLLQVAQDYIPETIVTNHWQVALEFFEHHKIIVAKRPNSCGGRGVFKIEYRDRAFHVDHFSQGSYTFADFDAVMAYVQRDPSENLIFMKYLTGVTAGDKRIVVVDGEIYGAYLRRSESGHWVNNISGDGQSTLATVTTDERAAIAATVGHYKKLGLHTLGYDFLQDAHGNWCISEINAGNIGGFAWLEMLTGQPVMAKFISWLRDFAQQPTHHPPILNAS